MSKEQQLAEYHTLKSRWGEMQSELAMIDSRLDVLSGKIRELSSAVSVDKRKALELLNEIVCAELRDLVARHVELTDNIKRAEELLARF
jgi:hypothetical protein